MTKRKIDNLKKIQKQVFITCRLKKQGHKSRAQHLTLENWGSAHWGEHSSKRLLLCSTDVRNINSYETTGGWINDSIFTFGWTIPLMNKYKHPLFYAVFIGFVNKPLILLAECFTSTFCYFYYNIKQILLLHLRMWHDISRFSLSSMWTDHQTIWVHNDRLFYLPVKNCNCIPLLTKYWVIDLVQTETLHHNTLPSFLKFGIIIINCRFRVIKFSLWWILHDALLWCWLVHVVCRLSVLSG